MKFEIVKGKKGEFKLFYSDGIFAEFKTRFSLDENILEYIKEIAFEQRTSQYYHNEEGSCDMCKREKGDVLVARSLKGGFWISSEYAYLL